MALGVGVLVLLLGFFTLLLAKPVPVSRKSPRAQDLAPVGQVPELFDRLVEAGQEGAFVGFAIRDPAGSSDTDDVYIQFSLEEGRVGLDWVLLSSKNVKDRDRFLEVAEMLGYSVVRKEMNEVPYLRVEEGRRLPTFCVEVMHRLYGLRSTDQLEVHAEGINWSPRD